MERVNVCYYHDACESWTIIFRSIHTIFFSQITRQLGLHNAGSYLQKGNEIYLQLHYLKRSVKSEHFKY